jgi:histidinol-phosphate/aromatic aminotransferase/cobyric acid decarboxylase-like protein
LPSQLGAVTALNDEGYYQEKYEETHVLRRELIKQLHDLGITDIIDGVANFILFFLPDHFPDAHTFVEMCKTRNLFLRDVKAMGTTLGDRAIRIAVKDAATNDKMIKILRGIMDEIQHARGTNISSAGLKVEELQ